MLRSFRMGSRYEFDGKLTSDQGWVQYDTDQDAWYFGVWVNPTMRCIVSYAEGDVTYVACPTEAIFRKEVDDMNDFYGPPPRDGAA